MVYRLRWNDPPGRSALSRMGLRRPIVRRPGSTRPSGLNIVPSWICWKLRMAPIVFGPIRPSTASAGAGPPQEGGTRFSISWMVLMSLLRLAPPSPTEAEIVRGMETSPSAHRIHLRGQLQHRVEAHLLVFRAEVEQAVDVRSEEHTSELQSLMRISYAVFCLKKKRNKLHLSTIHLKHKTTNTIHNMTI